MGYHCAVLFSRDYSDLKRLRCLLNVQSSKQQVVFSKDVVCEYTPRVSARVHFTSLCARSLFIRRRPCFLWLLLSPGSGWAKTWSASSLFVSLLVVMCSNQQDSDSSVCKQPVLSTDASDYLPELQGNSFSEAHLPPLCTPSPSFSFIEYTP